MKRNCIILICLLIFTGCSSMSINDGKISRYFTAREALYSSTGNRYGIKNKVKGNARENIYYTARRMDRVRAVLKEPIHVTSWYRNTKINKKVGGSRSSAHREGLAVDFRVKSNPRYVYTKLKKKNVSFDQLIYYPRQRRLHISFKRNWRAERNQYFIR